MLGSFLLHGGATQLHTFLFIFFSVMVHCRMLNIVPCALQ